MAFAFQMQNVLFLLRHLFENGVNRDGVSTSSALWSWQESRRLPMQSHGKRARIWPLLRAAICLAVAALAGCSSDSARLKREPVPVASRLGLSDCRVSVPLTSSQVIDQSLRSGNPNPEEDGEWAAMLAALQPGDQLREVSCPNVRSGRGYRDPYYFALFRDDLLVLKFHPVILD